MAERVGGPLARQGHPCAPSARRRCAYPRTSQHTSVGNPAPCSPRTIARLVGPKGRHKPDRTAVWHDSEAGRMTLGGPLRIHGPGPLWVRTALVIRGSRRARAVTTSTTKRQVTAPSRPEPRSLEHGRRGVEYHLMAAAGRRPLPTRLVSPWTGLTYCPSWSRRHQVGAAVVLTGRAISAIPSTTPPVHHGPPLTLLTV
jgi:hypothetical protein